MPEKQLDLGRYLRALPAGERQQRMVGPHRRVDDHAIRADEIARVVPAEMQRVNRQVAKRRDRFGKVLGAGQLADRELRAGRSQVPGGADAAAVPAQPHERDAARGPVRVTAAAGVK